MLICGISINRYNNKENNECLLMKVSIETDRRKFQSIKKERKKRKKKRESVRPRE